MLLLSVILHQTSRPKYYGKYLTAVSRFIIAFALGQVGLVDWVILFVLAYLWSHTARPNVNDRAAWVVIQKGRKTIADRMIWVWDEFLGVQKVDGEQEEATKIFHSENSTNLTTNLLGADKTQVETEGEQHVCRLWIAMDNEPPLDTQVEDDQIGDQSEDPCFVPIPLSPSAFLVEDGTTRESCRSDSDSMAMLLNLWES